MQNNYKLNDFNIIVYIQLPSLNSFAKLHLVEKKEIAKLILITEDGFELDIPLQELNIPFREKIL